MYMSILMKSTKVAFIRCRELKKLNCNAFVMFNIDNEQTKRIKDLKWWSKGKAVFWLIDLADFNSRARAKAVKA